MGFLWGEITTREYWWTRDAEKAKLVKTLTCFDLAGTAAKQHTTYRMRPCDVGELCGGALVPRPRKHGRLVLHSP